MDQAICELVKSLQKSSPNALDDMRARFSPSTFITVMEASEKRHALLTEGISPSIAKEMHAWERRYRAQVRAAHGYIEPPDFERKRKIPIEDLYVSPRIGTARSETQQLLSFDQFEARIDRTVLLGDPGGGKSTAANALAFRAAREESDLSPSLSR